jgi:hypothetical protein
MITDLFRFAALVTQTSGISAYFSQNCGMVNLLLELYEKERNGAVKNDRRQPDIDPKVRHWMYRKGFTETQHINELEKNRGLADSFLYHPVACLLYKANGFVDWFDGATREEIAEPPQKVSAYRQITQARPKKPGVP